MECTSPKLAYRNGDNPLQIIGSVNLLKPSEYRLPISSLEKYKTADEQFLLPCGRCVSCRLNYSREWANRCYLESLSHTHNYFVTLTYDSSHLATNFCVDKSTGEVLSVPILNRIDLVNFVKRVRKHWKDKHNHEDIRVYYCGEYGSKGSRPHYHIIFFNLPLYDLSCFGKPFFGAKYYNYVSSELSKLWSCGFVNVNIFTWETAAYTARYMLKKAKGTDAQVFREIGVPQEFVGMSRMPGIAYEYYHRFRDSIYADDKIYVNRGDKVVSSQPPAYFDRLLSVDDPQMFERVKAARKQTAEYSFRRQLALHPYDYAEYLKKEADKFQSEFSSVSRRLENEFV